MLILGGVGYGAGSNPLAGLKATRKNYAGEKIRTMTIVGAGSLAGCIPIDYC
jgi:hypothetical protein